ncbi:hypothetical protein I7V28_10935 [Lelliottia amnigena]|uniref:hypothetical protein n=1 Tax=Lelliottia amnigena TaxID=61646 RepID=UPI00192BC7C2|nr:hypothetical protein [Lelliottia amnigena]
MKNENAVPTLGFAESVHLFPKPVALFVYYMEDGFAAADKNIAEIAVRIRHLTRPAVSGIVIQKGRNTSAMFPEQFYLGAQALMKGIYFVRAW